MTSGGGSLQNRSRQAFWFACASILLGFGAQSALANGHTSLGLILYALALGLFVWRMRPYTSENLPVVEILDEHEAIMGGPHDNWNKLKYLRYHWREMTLAEIFSGAIPILTESGEPVPVDTVLVPPEVKPTSSGQDAGPLPVITEKLTPQVVSPPLMKRTPSGEVYIFDANQGMVYRFDLQNVLVAQWPIPMSVNMDVTALVISHNSVILVDSTGDQAHVIHLDPDESA